MGVQSFKESTKRIVLSARLPVCFLPRPSMLFIPLTPPPRPAPRPAGRRCRSRPRALRLHRRQRRRRAFAPGRGRQGRISGFRVARGDSGGAGGGSTGGGGERGAQAALRGAEGGRQRASAWWWWDQYNIIRDSHQRSSCSGLSPSWRLPRCCCRSDRQARSRILGGRTSL